MRPPRGRLSISRIMIAVAVLAVLPGVVVEVRRRSNEFRGLSLQHRADAIALTGYHLFNFDPRVTKQELAEKRAKISMFRDWHERMAERFERAANHPWLPLEPGPPKP